MLCSIYSGMYVYGIDMIMANFGRNVWSQFTSVNKNNWIFYD